MTTLGVIIARGASKRLPGKNIRLLGGRPLIAWSVAAANSARHLDRSIVSTDDSNIADAAHAAGGEVPFLRPRELATDLASAADVLRHAAAAMDKLSFVSDVVVLLQTTSPFRSASLIDEAITRFRDKRADTLTSVRSTPAHPYWVWRGIDGRIEPFFDRECMQMERAVLPPAFVETGTIYVVRRSVLDSGTLYGDLVVPLEVGPAESHDIDTLEDFGAAEAMLARGEAVWP